MSRSIESLQVAFFGYCFLLLVGILTPSASLAEVASFTTPLKVQDLDPAAFSQWFDGADAPMSQKDGPRHVIWTQDSAPEWDGVSFGESRTPGPRFLRLGWKNDIPVGSVLVRGGGQVSALRSNVPYPGTIIDDKQWIAAQRLRGGRVSEDEVGGDDYAVWVFPPGTITRALRFKHTANPIDHTFGGWLGGAFVLSERVVNVAPQALASASARDEVASRINNETNDGTWNAWDNGPDFSPVVISPDHPEWVSLTWPRAVQLSALNALWAGFGTAEVQTYIGPAGQSPRDAKESDWQSVQLFDKIENQYPRSLGVNWMSLTQPLNTRAIRLRMFHVTRESHPHLTGNTHQGKRVWLGELMALQPLGSSDLKSAIIPPPVVNLGHPPIPVRFTLTVPAYVTLVIEDSQGMRVRNLVSDSLFPAGSNVVWWDGTDDLGRDRPAAAHGLYHIPASFVPPGEYQVRGLVHQQIDLKYEFPVYNAGNPAWATADHTGAWLANHTPPSSALFVPGSRTISGKPLVFLGSYVSEGTDGLAWVDLDGKKQGGETWVGGNWTGAPYLAFDAGDHPVADVMAYAGAAWETELRLTALTTHGDKPVLKYTFDGGKDKAALAGMAIRNGILICSLPKLNELLVVDAAAGKVLSTIPADDPRGLAVDGDGRLLVLSGQRLLREPMPGAEPPASPAAPDVVIAAGLEDPQAVTTDAAGLIYVSDRGSSHQVKVFRPDGKSVKTIGHPRAPKAGTYDPLHMNNPNGITIDENHHLWVAETDFQPKRVSVWTLDGQLLKALYGPSQYGGGGTLDPKDRTRFYYDGMEFKLDWQKGVDQLVDVFCRPGPEDLKLPDGYGASGNPETPIYANGRQYMTNAFTSNPTNGAGIALLWMMKDSVAVPVAAMGRANDWSIFKGDAFKPFWPTGIDLKGDYWRNQALFAWSDLNGDGQIQPDEVQFIKAGAGGMTVMPDLSFVASRANDSAVRFAPTRFTPKGAPVYDLKTGDTLVPGAQGPTSSGGDQVLTHPDGWTILTVAPKPFAPESLGGALKGKAVWSYPSLWPGLHASHESPAPDRPGELIGTTRLIGGFFRPRGGEGGPLWAINGNMGCMYVFTEDGLFVATLFKDQRIGHPWSMPIGQRGMLLNDTTLHDENFWPTITSTNDGHIYLVDGGRTSLVRVEGLETIHRLKTTPLRVGSEELKAAQEYIVRSEAVRQHFQGPTQLRAPIRSDTPVVDGKMDDWAAADWAVIDRSGVAAYFDSKSKPYNVTAAIAVSGDRLYAAFRTGDPNLLRNSGESPTAPFKTGGALDLMIGVNPHADPRRSKPEPGDERLLVTQVKGKTLALIYRASVPGTRDPVSFSSPWRTITIDRVDDVSDQVHLAGADGNYEFSIPLTVLGLKIFPGEALKADLGILRGDGIQTIQRVYWSNKATAIVSDVPSEAMLTPDLWGKLVFGDE